MSGPRPLRRLGSPCHRLSSGNHFCFLSLAFLAIALVQHQHHHAFAASSFGHVVTSLPGFDGRLPFYLETGYVEVDKDNGGELFYYFVEFESESESGTADTPFILWLTGGDRCSVFSGLAYEIGPIQFVIEPYNGTLPRLQYNPYSWSQVSHILFVDSPLGAGFSFSTQPKGYEVGDISASLMLHEFVIKWFNDHPKYLANHFYVGGDSYAGKLVPFLAQMISEDIETGRAPLLNLKGYLVGNPVTGEIVDKSSKVTYAHGFGIISDQLYKTIVGHCHGEDYINPTNLLCDQALATFNDLLSEIFPGHVLLDNCVYVSPVPNKKNRRNGSDRRKILREEIGAGPLNHPPERPPFSCFMYKYYLSYFWANDKRSRDALGIKKGTVDEWVRCHDNDLPYSYDLKSSIKYHRDLTSRGYRALVYSGDHDPQVPHLGTQAWVRSLGYDVVDDWRAWHLGGQAAGFTISYSNNLTFATIKGGGHTAPEYEPERCFAMFSRWILNGQL